MQCLRGWKQWSKCVGSADHFCRCLHRISLGQKAGHVDLDARREFGAVKAIASLQLKDFSFIVLTLFAVWLGWNVSVVQPHACKMIEGRPGGGGIMAVVTYAEGDASALKQVKDVSPRTFSRH